MSKINLKFDLAEYVKMDYGFDSYQNSSQFLQLFADLIKLDANIELVNLVLFYAYLPTKIINQLDIINAMHTPDLKANVSMTLDPRLLEENFNQQYNPTNITSYEFLKKIGSSQLTIKCLLTPLQTQPETALMRLLMSIIFDK